LWRYETGTMRLSRVHLRPFELLRFAEQHTGMGTSLTWGRRLRALLPRAFAACLHYLMARHDLEQATRVCAALERGEGLTRQDPEYVAREQLLRLHGRATHLATLGKGAAVVLAWNARRQGKVVPQGMVWRGLTDATVPFPQLR